MKLEKVPDAGRASGYCAQTGNSAHPADALACAFTGRRIADDMVTAFARD